MVEFVTSIPPGGPLERRGFRFIATRANRQPAVAAYRLDAESGTFRAWCILVLSADGDEIAEITTFADPR